MHLLTFCTNEKICPLCCSCLSQDDASTSQPNISKNSYKEFSCRNHSDHFFIKRITHDNRLLKIKIRITDSDSKKIFIQVNYDTITSDFWSWSNGHLNNKITLNNIIDLPSFKIIDIINKIKTYTIFS